MTGQGKNRGRCILCGSPRNVEQNHIGGRNHVIWITMPFCRPHHDQFHQYARDAEIDLRYSPDPEERAVRALRACQIAQWMITEQLQIARNEKRTIAFAKEQEKQ